MYKFKVKPEIFCLDGDDTDFEEVEIYTKDEFSKLSKDQKQKYAEDEFYWLDFIIDQPENPGTFRKLKDLVDENCLKDFKDFIKEDIVELDEGEVAFDYGVTESIAYAGLRDFVLEGLGNPEITHEISEKYKLYICQSYYLNIDDQETESYIEKFGYDLSIISQ